MRLEKFCIGVVCRVLNKSGDGKSVGCDVDVLWSFDGVFPEIVDGVQALPLVGSEFCAVDFKGLRKTSAEASYEDNNEDYWEYC